MNISKRGPQLVLVATLLMMLHTVGCAAMPSSARVGDDPCRRASCSYGYLFVQRRGSYDSLVSVYRNDTVDASSRERTLNSLLRFQSDVSRTETAEDGKLYIHIYNQRAKRYICFKRSGKVKTLRRLPSSRSRHGRLTCRFEERMQNAGPDQSHLLTMYVADEPHRRRERVISFCRGRQASLRRLPSASARRASHRQQRQRAARRGARRRLRPERSVPRPRQTRRHQRRHHRPRCQFVFMKDTLPLA